MEVENATFQDLACFGMREGFQNGYREVLDFCFKNSKSILEWM